MKYSSYEFNHAFNENAVQLYAKADIQLGSNRFNDNQVISSSETKQVKVKDTGVTEVLREFWRAEDVFDDKCLNTMKWLVCDAGATVKEVADGTGYRAISLDRKAEYERGWWSAEVSDEFGTFDNVQYVESTFDERRANKIALYLDAAYDNMKYIQVEYRNQSNAWFSLTWGGMRMLAPDEYVVEWNVPNIQITGLRVTVYGTYRPFDHARVIELNAYYNIEVQDEIVSMDISDTREEYEQTVPIGTTAANTLTIELENVDARFSPFSDSLYSPYIGAGCKIVPYYGVNKNPEHGPDDIEDIEWVQMGEFWSDDWSVSGDSVTSTVSCRDFSRFLQDDKFYWGKVWQNTNMKVVLRDLMAYYNIPPERVHIDETDLNEFGVLFVKDTSVWGFLGEAAFADQGMFGFDSNGDFFYHSYNRLDSAPYTTSVWELDQNTNLGSVSNASVLFANKVTVSVSEFDIYQAGVSGLWSPPSPTILSWAQLGNSISSSATTINIAKAPRQDTGNLTDNGWPNKNGYLCIPHYNTPSPTVFDVKNWDACEIIKYKSRSETQLFDCERGMFGTQAEFHPAGAYIGEARSYNMEWNNAPATQVKWPYVTAIDSLQKKTIAGVDAPEIQGYAQAFIAHFNSDAFGGQMVITNTVDWYTYLMGDGKSLSGHLRDLANVGNTNYDGSLYELNFATSVAGAVYLAQTSAQNVTEEEDPDAVNKNYLRRYGKNELEIDNPWIQNVEDAQKIADAIIREYEKPRPLLEVEAFIPPTVSTGDRVTITGYDQLEIYGVDFHVVKVDYSFDGGWTCSLTLRKVSEVGG